MTIAEMPMAPDAQLREGTNEEQTQQSNKDQLQVTDRLEKLLRHKPLIFAYNLAVLGGLCAVMVAYFQGRLTFLPASVNGLPLYAIWFGALGGLVYSMKWVNVEGFHGEALWYYGRPFTGAIVGGMTYVLLQALTPTSTPSTPVVEAAAFIVGIQERRFFDLLFRVADVILSVPDEQDPSKKANRAAGKEDAAAAQA